jgi:serine/threonine-protein kinase PknG
MNETRSVNRACAHCGGRIVDGACEDCGKVPAGGDLLGAGPVTVSTVTRSSTARRTTSRTVASTIKISVAVGGASARVAGTRGSTSRRRALGGGLISLPNQPSLEPLSLLMADPSVPPQKRVCAKCGKPAVREKGFCTGCGAAYNFRASLQKDDLVAGQYRIAGPIAYGGLGWIYLAKDEFLSRWVVLKGLLNSADEEAAAAAMAERQFLAAVKHPKIVGIFNFVHQGTEGFIVMEYVGGRTVKSIRKERGPLPVAEAIAYVLGILPAFAYLHGQGLVYCDFKPDNFMLEGDDVKLIDMGAVRKIGDPDGAVFATVGYMAPEADQDPTAVSDLYTIGRALAQLIMDFPLATRDGKELPYPETAPALLDNESLKLFLDRACAQDPALRFQSADEMFDQLFGVLREVVSLDKDEPKPAVSELFLGDGLVDPNDDAIWKPSPASLPRARPDPDDSAAGALMAAANLRGDKYAAYLLALGGQFPRSKELRYAALDHAVAGGRFADAEATIKALLAADPYDWRAWLQQGRIAFLQGDFKAAAERFARLRAELPGEPAAQLALALALEAFGEGASAEAIYDRVSRADPAYASAAFGLARRRIAAHDRAGAAKALDRVPATSALYIGAQLAKARALIADMPGVLGALSPQRAAPADLVQAGETLESLNQSTATSHLLAAEIFMRGVQLVEHGQGFAADDKLLGRKPAPSELRLGAEQALRQAARLSEDPQLMVALVERANQSRPRTFW